VSKRVAVQDGLDQVERALRKEGFEVTKLLPGTMANVDAAVISGMSRDFLGIQETQGNRFPVIDASGRTAEEIVQQIRSRTGPEEGR
jgi:hypothetical protein